MKLRIATPLDVVVDEDGVTALRAEDSSGNFGILTGHADFLTNLTISIVSWRNASDGRRYCAVRRGVLSVEGGHKI
ncbi:MAG: F0F1 ATP synthase subunit epsilon, partial [Roseiarcus sp.]